MAVITYLEALRQALDEELGGRPGRHARERISRPAGPAEAQRARPPRYVGSGRDERRLDHVLGDEPDL